MGAGNLCLVLDTPENREVAGDVAWYWSDEHELVLLLERAAGLGGPALEQARSATRAWAASRYSWSAVTTQYDTLIFGDRSPATVQASSPAAGAPTTTR
jgi:hypothetical protein